jgi:superfamily II DNA or RNA helicase
MSNSLPAGLSVGALVCVPELLSDGPARLTGGGGGFLAISFLASGARMTQDERLVQPWMLLPGAPVQDASGRRGVVRGAPRCDGLLVYPVTWDGGEAGELREDAIASVPQPTDAIEQLATAGFHDLLPSAGQARRDVQWKPWAPSVVRAREELLAWRDALWAPTGGAIGLAGARVEAFPHQLVAVRRILGDRRVRYLLADEVGLGKTIEAGLVMQSLLAMQPELRVLVVAPGALIGQWFLELHVRFGGRGFVMLDQERLRTWDGNPWADRQFVIASSRAVEDLSGRDALRFAQARWDLVVVDECHRMRPSGPLAKRVGILSRDAAHVLLLSATPSRRHADAWLALLQLLEPAAWAKATPADLERAWAVHAQAEELLDVTARDPAPARHAGAWRKLFPRDARITALAAELASGERSAVAALAAHLRAFDPGDRRVVRQRRAALAQLEAAGGGALPRAVRSHEALGYRPDAAEERVYAALATYRQALLAEHDAPPPRLAHWLLQLELAATATPRVLERLCSLRAAVLADPDAADEYRVRALLGERLADVLRTDLSEAETTTQVAISAACHADPAVESEPLAALRSAVAAWAKVKAGPRRAAALAKRLEQFWDERPGEKILVFTAQSMAVEELAALLARSVGEQAIATFGAHLDEADRESAATRFRSDPRCQILVSDPLGGEGRNLQYASVVVHHDLPWSVAAVEQRIGRVDRIGRDGEVPSWVCGRSDGVGADAWGSVLQAATGVFTASASGLEFVADRIEAAALEALLAGRLAEAAPALAALVADERADSDARLAAAVAADAPAFTAAVQRAAQLVALAPPVDAVGRWVRVMGGSLRRQEEHPRPYQLRSRINDQPIHGVFDRATALSHPPLAFFAPGNDAIDRILDDAANASWCRCAAWRRPAATPGSTWQGLRAVLSLSYDLAAFVAAGEPMGSLRRLLVAAPPEQQVIFVRADGREETDAAILAHLAKPFDARTDTVFSRGRSRDAWAAALLAGKAEPVLRWQQSVRSAGVGVRATIAARLPQWRANAAAALSAALADGLASVQAVAAASAEADPADPVARQAAREAEGEARSAAALHAAVAGATIEVVSVQYIAVG